MIPIAGLKIIEDTNLGSRVQVRFPRSKRKRIRRKWSKDQRNYVFKPDTAFYTNIKGGYIICHPSMADEIRRQIAHANHEMVQ